MNYEKHLRQKIGEATKSGASKRDIARASGVAEPHFYNFTNGVRGMTLQTAQRVHDGCVKLIRSQKRRKG